MPSWRRIIRLISYIKFGSVEFGIDNLDEMLEADANSANANPGQPPKQSPNPFLMSFWFGVFIVWIGLCGSVALYFIMTAWKWAM